MSIVHTGLALPAPLTLVTFLTMGLALLFGLWRIRWAFIPAGVALVGAGIVGHLNSASALALALGGGLVWIRTRGPVRFRGWALAGLALLVLSMGLHLVPGFHTEQIFEGPLSPRSGSFTLRWNLDKACAGMLLLMAGIPTSRPEGQRKLWAWAALPLAATILIASTLGTYVWDPKVPSIWPAWLLANLCFVCIPEEALFRMTLQPALEQAFDSPWMALVVTSLFFGLAHAQGGWLYCLVAIFAGLAYGLAYQVRRVPWHPVALHLGLNALHFFLFAYPA